MEFSLSSVDQSALLTIDLLEPPIMHIEDHSRFDQAPPRASTASNETLHTDIVDNQIDPTVLYKKIRQAISPGIAKFLT